MGEDATTGHVEDFQVWLDDLAAFWRDWQANTPGPHVLAAHSMGAVSYTHLTLPTKRIV